MKNKTKLLPLSLLAIVGIAGLAGCSNDSGVTYTYHDATSGNPERWAPATWKTSEDTLVSGYTEIGLVDYVLNDTKDGYKVVPEMAAEIPTDVTSTLTDAEVEKYGMNTTTDDTGAAKKYSVGQKWQVKLNQKAVFEDGTAINADTYVNSLKDLLDPEMQNYRAGDYASGTTAIAGGLSYLHSGRTLLEEYIDGDGVAHAGKAAKEGWYFNAYTVSSWWGGYSFADLCGYLSDAHSPAAAELLADEATFGNDSSPKDVRIDDKAELKEKIATVCGYILKDAFGMSEDKLSHDFIEGDLDGTNYSMASWCLRYYTYDKYSFDNVGISKVDDYTFNIYFTNPVGDFYAKQFFSGNWIVKQSLWDSLRTAVADSDLYSTTYGTSKDTYVAYGPYKIDTFQADKEFDFVRNDKWYGYTDGNHEGQYQVDKIEVQYVASADTTLNLFRTGKIDGYSLRSQDLNIFGSSSRLMYTPQSYTTKLTVNSVYDKLKENQDKDTKGNHTILSNDKFRQALSLGLDRKTLCQTQTAGWRGFDVPINFMYVSDPETGVAYRDTAQGKKVVTDNFGVDSDGEPNYFGYDLAQARKLIDEAVEEESKSTREGHYVEGQNVHLLWESYNEGWDDMINWVVDAYKELVKGTKLEGKLDIEVKISGTAYSDHIMAGSCEFGISTWGGAQFDPFSILQCYTVSDNMYEPYPIYKDSITINVATGDWDVDKTKVTGNADDIVTMSLGGDGSGQKPGNWTYELISGKYSAALADANTRLNILSACESYIVGTYNFITWGARQSVSINSYRVTTGTDQYVQLVGFGGIRFLKLTKTDSDWNNWVNSNLGSDGFIDYNK